MDANTIGAFWLEMADDPEMQALRQFSDGTQAFNDDEFVSLLEAVMPTFLKGEVDQDAALREINQCFGILKLYRLHESFLSCILSGSFVVKGVDSSEPNALILESAR